MESCATAVLAEKCDSRSLLDCIRSYGESLRHNAALIRDLAGENEGAALVDRKALYNAMQTQVYLAEGVLTFRERMAALFADDDKPPASSPH
jgi:hypothetical protein